MAVVGFNMAVFSLMKFCLIVLAVITTASSNFGMAGVPISMEDTRNVINVTEGDPLEFVCDLKTEGLTYEDDILQYGWYQNDFWSFKGNQDETLSFKANRKITKVTCKIFKVNNSSKSINEASVNLNVQYPPTVKLEVKHGVTLGEVHKDKPYSFNCTADANPQPILFRFYRNGNLIQNDNSSSYDIKSAKPSDEGNYSCAAVNTIGENSSNALPLKVLNYAPECQKEKETIYFEQINETRSLTCNVYSNPEPTEYRWSTGETTRTISYTIRNNSELLQCWAKNIIDKQETKCDIEPHLLSVPITDCTSVSQRSMENPKVFAPILILLGMIILVLVVGIICIVCKFKRSRKSWKRSLNERCTCERDYHFAGRRAQVPEQYSCDAESASGIPLNSNAPLLERNTLQNQNIYSTKIEELEERINNIETQKLSECQELMSVKDKIAELEEKIKQIENQRMIESHELMKEKTKREELEENITEIENQRASQTHELIQEMKKNKELEEKMKEIENQRISESLELKEEKKKNEELEEKMKEIENQKIRKSLELEQEMKKTKELEEKKKQTENQKISKFLIEGYEDDDENNKHQMNNIVNGL